MCTHRWWSLSRVPRESRDLENATVTSSPYRLRSCEFKSHSRDAITVRNAAFQTRRVGGLITRWRGVIALIIRTTSPHLRAVRKINYLPQMTQIMTQIMPEKSI